MHRCAVNALKESDAVNEMGMGISMKMDVGMGMDMGMDTGMDTGMEKATRGHGHWMTAAHSHLVFAWQVEKATKEMGMDDLEAQKQEITDAVKEAMATATTKVDEGVKELMAVAKKHELQCDDVFGFIFQVGGNGPL